MNSIDVQGTKTYILPVPATAWTDCAAAITAIQAGTEALCPQSLGEFSRSRAVTELGCVSSNNSVKSAGKISYGDFSMQLLFDETDTAGQKALYDAMTNNTPVILATESPDTGTGSGTIVWTEALVTGDTIGFPDGSKVTYDVTMSPYGGFTRCAAA